MTVGNAREDAAAFRHWLIGDLAQWSGLGAAARERFGLRDTRQVAIKWGAHAKDERRPGGWAAADEFVTLSVLVSGDFVLMFEDGPAGVSEVRLSRPGDYALWAPGTRHTWRVAAECVVLTVRWRDR